MQFEIRKMSGDVVGTYTTDRQGLINLPSLEAGWYQVIELKAADGYKLDPTPAQVCVKDGQTTQLMLTNKRMASIMIHKIDSQTKKGIYGVKFVLYDEGKNPLGEYTTDFTNTPKQNVIIRKYVEGTTTPLPGVTFFVTDSSGMPIGSADGRHITDENGMIVLSGLTPGTTLLVREVRTVKGYELNSTIQTIVVGADGYAQPVRSAASAAGSGNELVFYDEPLSTLVIRKFIEGTDREPLAGVAFEITDGNGGAVGNSDGVWYTNSEGEIVIPDLEQGMVITVREVKTRDGYVLDGTPKQVQIKSSDVHELVFWNARRGSLTIHALDSSTMQPIEGVWFKITTATGEFVPDKDGKISSNGLYKTDNAGEIVLTGVTGRPSTTTARAAWLSEKWTV